MHINCTLPVLPTTLSFYDIKSKSLILHSSQGHPLSLQKHIKWKFYLPLWVIKCHEFFLQKNISMMKYINYFPLIVYMTVSFSKSYFYLIFASHEQKLFASTPEYTAMPVMELMKLKKSLISDQWGLWEENSSQRWGRCQENYAYFDNYLNILLSLFQIIVYWGK